MTDVVTHPDIEIEAQARHLLFNVVGIANIGDPRKIFTINDVFASIAQQFGPAEARRVYIKITWH
jgi:hypothetical protein